MVKYTLQELLDEYVFQRENLVSSDQALDLLGPLTAGLNESEHSQLIQQIREWEKSRPLQRKQIRNTPVEKTRNREENYSYSAVKPEDIEMLAEIGDSSRPVLNVSCPHCNTLNPEGAAYCYACGQLIKFVAHDSTEQLYSDVEDSAIFGMLASLTLVVQGYEYNPLRVQIGDKPVLIGRITPESSDGIDIDLDPFNGKEMGVSRIHAAFQREERTLVLVDKDSVNHTYINDEKVHPHERRVVRDGDEIRFGRLSVQVTFQRELRRL